MKINESAGWIAIFNGKKCEIGKDEAKDLWGAKQLAIKKLGVPKSRVGELAIDVAFEDEEDDVSNAQFEELDEAKDIDKTQVKNAWRTILTNLQNAGLYDLLDTETLIVANVLNKYLNESLKEAKDIEVKDIEKMTELEPGDEVEVTKEMDDVFDTSLEMAKEFGEPKLETFDEQMDFLAKDEQEAIDGYEKVIALVEDEHVKEQLEKILVEEKAHKEFLEKVKEDHELEYTEPLEEPKEVEVDDVEVIDEVPEEEVGESLEEDTVKQNGKWVNKGDEGTHGKFKTKKEADAQRKAMFANGYHEDIEEDVDDDFGFNHILDEEHDDAVEIDWNSLDDDEKFSEVVMHADDDVLDDVFGKDTIERKVIKGARDIKKGLEKTEEKHVCEKCGKEVCECDKITEEEKARTGHIRAKKPIEIKTRIEK